VNDEKVVVTGPITEWEKPRERVVAPPARLEAELMRAVESVSGQMWPGVPVVPTMETGGTDGYYLRPAGIPTFGVSGVFLDMDDVRAHGKDERVGVASFHEGVDFYYRLIQALSSGR
jgi:acetylornithine deacetylase/succinyl-diaminopimelate desuccinylase-like protein